MDGLVYFSPCHAGCGLNYKWMDGPMGKFKVHISTVCFISKKSFVHICFESQNNWGFFQAYMDCTCIQNSFMYAAMMENKTREAAETTTISVTSSTVISNQTNATAMPNAFQGICPGDCKLIWVVVPLLFIGMLMTFTTVSPTQTATLR